MMDHSFRTLSENDVPFLKEMFYVSLFVPLGDEPFLFSIIEKPHLARYYEGWGRESDYGIIVSTGEEDIGAIWVRFFSERDKGYGFVKAEAPEMGIAIKKEHRGKGLGQELMNKLFMDLQEQGVPAVSLSTDLRNQAYHLYQKNGFVEISREENSCVMLKEFV